MFDRETINVKSPKKGTMIYTLEEVVMFLGRRKVTLKSDGSFKMPALFLDILLHRWTNKIIVTEGLEKCLFIAPYSQQLLIRFSNVKYEDYEIITIKNRSTVTLPKRFIEYAELKEEVMILGVMEILEIWNPELLKEFDLKIEDVFNKLDKDFVIDFRDMDN